MGSGSSKSRPTTPSKKANNGSAQSSSKKETKDKANLETIQNQMSLEPRDVMISYSHADKVVMNKLKEGLEKRGITVWVDVIGLKAGVDFLSKIGQAIIDAELFISLLSEKTIESKYCQDELALGYVSNKPIFPVGLKEPGTLFPKMDTGMKLQLARFQWYLFLDEESFEKDLDMLAVEMKKNLSVKQTDHGMALHTVSLPIKSGESAQNDKGQVGRQNTLKVMGNKAGGVILSDAVVLKISEPDPNKYWNQHFQDKDYIDWESFLQTFNSEFKEPIATTFSKEDQDWLISILRRELEVEENEEKVTKSSYLEFCLVDTDEYQSFWFGVQDKAVENYTMKEVFDMDSHVRVEAIENLGKYRSKPVIEALLDLLTDKDKNVVAVAAISLARTGASGDKVEKLLLKTLNDKDRLVRESGCLALGHLKSQLAVPKLVQLWRNDFISSVREAAQVALEQIGGDEANKAMHMTRVLADEIHMLTKE